MILVIIIAALISLIGATSLFNGQKDDVMIYNNTIDGVGSFNTVNVTNFTLDNSSNDKQTDYIANDSVSQITTTSSSLLVENTIHGSDRVNDSAKGHTIYKNTATVGEHKGEVRYASFLTDNEKNRHIMISTGDYNLTCMIVDSFKMF